MRGIRQRPLIDPTDTPHRGVYEGFMRGIKDKPLMAQALYTKEFPAIRRGLGLFSKGAEYFSKGAEYFEKVVPYFSKVVEYFAKLVEIRA